MSLPDTSNYYKQLHRHAPEEGLIGDCWRTCIANLLGLKPQQVPHFVGNHFSDPDPQAYHKAAVSWMEARGLRMVAIAYPADSAAVVARDIEGVQYILTGNSPNFAGIAHAVIGYGAFQCLHDPSPENKGLLGPITVDGQELYFVEFLVPINCADYLRKCYPE